jgi:hypothetical protein
MRSCISSVFKPFLIFSILYSISEILFLILSLKASDQGKSLRDPDSILACAKHYIAYGESTGGRDSYDVEVSLRKIREVFLPPFKSAADTGCATFMSGYQLWTALRLPYIENSFARHSRMSSALTVLS